MYKVNGLRFKFTDQEPPQPSAPRQQAVNPVRSNSFCPSRETTKEYNPQQEIEELKQRVARLEELVEKLSNNENK